MYFKSTLFCLILFISFISAQYFPLDPTASCQAYIGDPSGLQICDGFLANPNSIYINSSITQEQLQTLANQLRLYIAVEDLPEACKNSSATYTLICGYYFPECKTYKDPTSGQTYAYPIYPCYESCVDMTTTCQITRPNCAHKESKNGITYPTFPNGSATYEDSSDTVTFTETCLDTSNLETSTEIEKCPNPLVYHVTTNETYDKSIGYIFPAPNSTCVVQCPAPLYYANQWRNLYKLSDVLSLLSCILTLFLVVTLGVINPKISKFDRINLTLLSCIFLQSFSGALMTFNGTEHTLCPQPGRFASHIDHVCVATGFILHGTSLLVVQWWCIMSFEVWLTVFQVGKRQKDRYYIYLIASLIIAWVPPIVSVANKQYNGGPANPFCWLTDSSYQKYAFWTPLGIFLCLGGVFLLLLIREIYVIVKGNKEATKEDRFKILRMEAKPMISLVMYFSILLYLFIYDQWIYNHMYIYTDSIPTYANCLLTSLTPANCLLKAPDIAGFGYFIYSLRVFGVYAFLVYGISGRTVAIWKYNYFVRMVSAKLDQMTGASTTEKSNTNLSSGTSLTASSNFNSNTLGGDDSSSVEMQSKSDV